MRPPLVLLSSLLLLGATPSSDTRLNFEYEIPPCFQGRRGKIHISVNTSRFPTFYYYLAYPENGAYVFPTCKSYVGDGGYAEIDIPIPAKLTQRRTFTVQFGFSENDPRTNGPVGYGAFVEKELSVGERYLSTIVDRNLTINANRYYHHYDAANPQAEVSENDIYSFSGYHGGAVVSNRKLPIEDHRLSYYHPLQDKADLSQISAELRILDHLDDFLPFGTKVGNAYVSVPLKVKTQSEDGHHYQVTFGLTKSYYYDLYSFALSDHYGGDTFVSNRFFVPLRMDYDIGAFRYQIAITDVSENDDSFIIDDSVTFASRLFGPCGNADYCVVLGDDPQ